TVSDRCIAIRLVRRSRDEAVERFRKREAEAAAAPIRAALTHWARKDTIETLRAARPDIPTELSDRHADICEPLLAIAELAGGEWPERARNALTELCTSESEEGDSTGVRLLSDTQNIFDASGTDRLPTKELLEALIAQES